MNCERTINRPSFALRFCFLFGAAILLTMRLATTCPAQTSDEAKAKEARQIAEAQRAQAISEQHHNAARIRQLTQELEARQKELEATHRAMEAEEKAFRQGQGAAEAMRRAAEKAQKEAESGRPNQLKAAALKRAQIELEEARGQLAQLHQRLAHGKQAPLPKDGEFQVFALKNSEAPDAARVLSEVLGLKLIRMAVDERTNSLVIFADKDTSEIVEALLLKLDQSVSETKDSPPTETLQLRIVWLLDGVEGKQPAVGIDTGSHESDGLVSPQVVEALNLLGFEDPKVVCQQVTTLTLSDDNRGEFQFAVPVLVNGKQWQFSGTGDVDRAANDRFHIRFEAQVGQPNSREKSRLSGSIYTPLGHYTVLGTTTFVETIYTPVEGGGETSRQEQHLSAYVVYLDRAPEFPGGKVLGEELNGKVLREKLKK